MYTHLVASFSQRLTVLLECARHELCEAPPGRAHTSLGALGPQCAAVRPQALETARRLQVGGTFSANRPQVFLNSSFCRHHRDSVYAVEFLCADAPTGTVGDGDTATVGTAANEEGENFVDASRGASGRNFQAGGELSAGCFATGSKDHTIAIWDLFADTITA